QGGTYGVENNQIETKTEFNTEEKEMVGQSHSYKFLIDTGKLTVDITDINGSTITFTRIDDGDGALAGVWRMAARMQDGKMSTIPDGPRKTVKILSGTRFQWVAMNTDTKEFFGTGGGIFTFTNGKYTENIEF